MATNRTTLRATPDQVFSFLTDAYQYPNWVVGAKKVRAVDANWPQVGSAFHHASGAAGEIEDKTEILEIAPGKRLVLRAHLRPLGIARVDIELEAAGTETIFTIREDIEPGTRLSRLRPLIGSLIYLRNIEALRRLRRCIHALEQRTDR